MKKINNSPLTKKGTGSPKDSTQEKGDHTGGRIRTNDSGTFVYTKPPKVTRPKPKK